MSQPADAPHLTRFSLRALLIAVVVISLCLYCVVLLRNGILQRQKISKQKQTVLTALDTITKETEAIRIKLGRAPANVAELEQLTGHSMPQIFGRPVEFHRTSVNSYYLLYSVEWIEGFSGNAAIYESGKPKAGWLYGF